MPSNGDNSEIFAAVDLGSNSFHLIVARYQEGHIVVLDRLREVVQLARGFKKKRGLHPESEARAVACLERFGQRLQSLNASHVRAVGTNTFRRAARNTAFSQRAESALGHPIDVITGQEEARLVYQGVMHSVSNVDGTQLVVDIGGGSTELILGEGLISKALFSLHMGCVAFSDQFFGNGQIKKTQFNAARLLALRELEPVVRRLKKLDWDRVRGASGTIKAVVRALNPEGENRIAYEGLRELSKKALTFDHVDELNLPGVSRDRSRVFLGGLAILMSVFEALSIEEMQACNGSLKEGLLFDLIGRYTHEDARQRSIRALEERYHVDQEQAQRVENTALDMLDQVKKRWSLPDLESENLLRWAAITHEIGLAVAHSHYQQHSAYLIHYSDLAGFSIREQSMLARIVGSHRRKMIGLSESGSKDDETVFKLTILLRLAVLLHRSRSAIEISKFELTPKKKSLEVNFPAIWLDENPLTRADLEYELGFWEEIDFRLKLS